MTNRNTGNSSNLIILFMRNLFSKLRQNPEFYNIRYYTRSKLKHRSQQSW